MATSLETKYIRTYVIESLDYSNTTRFLQVTLGDKALFWYRKREGYQVVFINAIQTKDRREIIGIPKHREPSERR